MNQVVQSYKIWVPRTEEVVDVLDGSMDYVARVCMEKNDNHKGTDPITYEQVTPQEAARLRASLATKLQRV